MIQNESRDTFGGNVYYVTMQITFLTCKFQNGERNLHCDVVHITTKWVSSLTLDCNGVFAIKACRCADVPCCCHAFHDLKFCLSSRLKAAYCARCSSEMPPSRQSQGVSRFVVNRSRRGARRCNPPLKCKSLRHGPMSVWNLAP